MEGEKRKILIVDDDTFLLDMYALKFSQNGFEVHTASGAEQALERLKGGLSPDILLTDIIMPGMDGFEMLKKINEGNLAVNSVRVILSNKGQHSDIEEGIKLGASGYIVKANSTPVEVIAQVIKIFEEKHK
ncbi:MAG TPA: response regulator [Candidatus Paceibacterota bacterium]|nr:response regulator [Candidatus Paceibacterota bacterium]